MPNTKPTNPKDAIGSYKLPTHLCPPAGTVEMTLALLDGALKYGAYNWREAGVRSSVYLDAIDRHRMKFLDGENMAPDSMVHHLGHIMACCAIMLDSIAQGNFIDDRPPTGTYQWSSAVSDGRTKAMIDSRKDLTNGCTAEPSNYYRPEPDTPEPEPGPITYNKRSTRG